MSSPVSVTSPSAFFPRSPRTPDSVELAPGAKASCNDGCDGDAQGANKGGECRLDNLVHDSLACTPAAEVD